MSEVEGKADLPVVRRDFSRLRTLIAPSAKTLLACTIG